MQTPSASVQWGIDLERTRERSDMKKLDPKTSILVIVGAAFGSFLLSVSLWFGLIGEVDREAGLFVGLWVPSILALGALLSPRGRTP
jgi:hypothetical protein